MVWMRKGDVLRYVPDVFVKRFIADGYIVDDDDVADVPVEPVSEPQNDEEAADSAASSDSESEHSEPERFCCPHCCKEYTKQASLTKHIAEKHQN